MIGPPKSDAGRRVVSLPTSLIADIERHLAEDVGPEPKPGCSRWAQAHHVDAGNWIRVDRGLFRLAEWVPGVHDEFARWVLWSGGRGVISHESALGVHQVAEFEAVKVHLTVPPNFTMTDPAVVIHRGSLEADDVADGGGFRLTSVIRSLIDAAAAEVDLDRTIEIYEADDGTIPFESFVDDLSDLKALALDAAVERVLRERGIDLVRTEWLKALGEGLHEFRIRHDAAEIARMFGGDVPEPVGRREKVLLRVFVHFHGARIVLLLGGYDKGVEPKEHRQQREIARARRLLREFRERERRQRG